MVAPVYYGSSVSKNSLSCKKSLANEFTPFTVTVLTACIAGSTHLLTFILTSMRASDRILDALYPQNITSHTNTSATEHILAPEAVNNIKTHAFPVLVGFFMAAIFPAWAFALWLINKGIDKTKLCCPWRWQLPTGIGMGSIEMSKGAVMLLVLHSIIRGDATDAGLNDREIPIYDLLLGIGIHTALCFSLIVASGAIRHKLKQATPNNFTSNQSRKETELPERVLTQPKTTQPPLQASETREANQKVG